MKSSQSERLLGSSPCKQNAARTSGALTIGADFTDLLKRQPA
jgi:hypothetical protein